MSRQKAKGTAFETAVARYLRWALDDERIERRTLQGVNDRGDIAGVRFAGGSVVLECKNTKQANLSQHLKEAKTEAANDDTTMWALVQKRHGVGISDREHVGQQLVVMELETFARFLNHGLELGADEVDGVQ